MGCDISEARAQTLAKADGRLRSLASRRQGFRACPRASLQTELIVDGNVRLRSKPSSRHSAHYMTKLMSDRRTRLFVLLQPLHTERMERVRIPFRHFLVVHRRIRISPSSRSRERMGARAVISFDPQCVDSKLIQDHANESSSDHFRFHDQLEFPRRCSFPAK